MEPSMETSSRKDKNRVYAIVNRKTTIIVCRYASAEIVNYARYSGDEYIHMEVPDDLSSRDVRAQLNPDSGALEIVADDAAYWDNVRTERNRRLTVTDWTQLADCSLDGDTLHRFREYRQTLRDFPAHVKDPRSVEWPESPSS